MPSNFFVNDFRQWMASNGKSDVLVISRILESGFWCSLGYFMVVSEQNDSWEFLDSTSGSGFGGGFAGDTATCSWNKVKWPNLRHAEWINLKRRNLEAKQKPYPVYGHEIDKKKRNWKSWRGSDARRNTGRRKKKAAENLGKSQQTKTQCKKKQNATKQMQKKKRFKSAENREADTYAVW